MARQRTTGINATVISTPAMTRRATPTAPERGWSRSWFGVWQDSTCERQLRRLDEHVALPGGEEVGHVEPA
jgi:hypothetical protein